MHFLKNLQRMALKVGENITASTGLLLRSEDDFKESDNKEHA